MSFFEVTRFFDRIERPKSAEKTNTTYKLNGYGFQPKHTKILLPVCCFHPIMDTEEILKILINKDICQTAIS